MIIDVHSHISSREKAKNKPIPPALLDVEGMLEMKAAAGIDLTIVGNAMLNIPGSKMDEYAPENLKEINDFLESMVAKHPRQLRAYACTNPFGGEQMMQEAAATVRAGGFIGLIINTSVRGEYLDSPRADPFFAMAADLDVPVFLHPPADAAGYERVGDYRLVEQVCRPGDVTLGIASLIYSGRLEKHPTLRFLAAMGGGSIATLAGRFDAATRFPYQQPPTRVGKPDQGSGGPPQGGPPQSRPPQGGPPKGPPRAEVKLNREPSAYLRQVNVDSVCYSLPALLANVQVLGVDHVFFGTDYPPVPVPLKDCVDLVRNAPLSESDREKILSGNARKLFKLEL